MSNFDEETLPNEKTYSQEEVERIVKDRMLDTENELLKKEQELNRRELEVKAKAFMCENNINEEILPILNFTDEKSLNEVLEIAKKYFSPYNNTPLQLGNAVPVHHGDEDFDYNDFAIRESMGLLK